MVKSALTHTHTLIGLKNWEVGLGWAWSWGWGLIWVWMGLGKGKGMGRVLCMKLCYAKRIKKRINKLHFKNCTVVRPKTMCGANILKRRKNPVFHCIYSTN